MGFSWFVFVSAWSYLYVAAFFWACSLLENNVRFPRKPLLVYLGFVENSSLALELKAAFCVVLFSGLKRTDPGLISSFFIP